MSRLNMIKSKKKHTPLNLDEKKSARLVPEAGAQIMKDFEHMAGEYKKIDAAGPSAKPQHVMETAQMHGWSTPAMGQVGEEKKQALGIRTGSKQTTPRMAGASGAHTVSHGGDVISSAPAETKTKPYTKPLKPGSTFTMQSVAKPESEKKVASMSGPPEGTLQAASAKAFKALKKAAEDQEKHYGIHYGTKEPKGSLSRIKKYKTKRGKIKNPPKSAEGKNDMASEMIAHHMHHLGRHPGGQKQAIAIGLNQAGESRNDKSMVQGSPQYAPLRPSHKMGIGEKSMESTKKSFDELMDLSKAVTARSLPRIPRALQPQKDIFRSAMDIPTNKDSRLAKDIPSMHAGYLKPDVLAQVRRDEEERTHREVNKSGELQDCDVCGRVFSKSFDACPTCQISKAAMCKACGHQMVKGRDGELHCSICG